MRVHSGGWGGKTLIISSRKNLIRREYDGCVGQGKPRSENWLSLNLQKPEIWGNSQLDSSCLGAPKHKTLIRASQSHGQPAASSKQLPSRVCAFGRHSPNGSKFYQLPDAIRFFCSLLKTLTVTGRKLQSFLQQHTTLCRRGWGMPGCQCKQYIIPSHI